jgi:hypothetical protein
MQYINSHIRNMMSSMHSSFPILQRGEGSVDFWLGLEGWSVLAVKIGTH